MEEYVISINLKEVKPIGYWEIVELAGNPATDDEYADYLKHVLLYAKRMMERLGGDIREVKFRVHKTGCIIPFGENLRHSYSRHFYSRVSLELPD